MFPPITPLSVQHGHQQSLGYATRGSVLRLTEVEAVAGLSRLHQGMAPKSPPPLGGIFKIVLIEGVP